MIVPQKLKRAMLMDEVIEEFDDGNLDPQECTVKQNKMMQNQKEKTRHDRKSCLVFWSE